jgi:hypothetical protein
MIEPRTMDEDHRRPVRRERAPTGPGIDLAPVNLQQHSRTLIQPLPGLSQRSE